MKSSSHLPPSILNSVLNIAFEASVLHLIHESHYQISAAQEKLLRSEALHIVRESILNQSNYCISAIQSAMDSVVAILWEQIE